jgi:hypothetical protein
VNENKKNLLNLIFAARKENHKSIKENCASQINNNFGRADRNNRKCCRSTLQTLVQSKLNVLTQSRHGSAHPFGDLGRLERRFLHDLHHFRSPRLVVLLVGRRWRRRRRTDVSRSRRHPLERLRVAVGRLGRHGVSRRQLGLVSVVVVDGRRRSAVLGSGALLRHLLVLLGLGQELVLLGGDFDDDIAPGIGRTRRSGAAVRAAVPRPRARVRLLFRLLGGLLAHQVDVLVVVVVVAGPLRQVGG